MGRECSDSATVRRLHREAQEALRRSRRPAAVLPLLERLAVEAQPGGEPWRFAQRALLELWLPQRPWQAALAARRLLEHEPDAPELHGALALAHSLLGHFRAAIAAYRRAIRLDEDNPWFHHNLGHLLDVVLDAPQQALSHLLLAWRAAPEEPELAASLAHCLARLGDFETAEGLASDALRADPDNQAHRNLLDWIRRRAPDGGPVAAAPSGGEPVTVEERPVSSGVAAVEPLLHGLGCPRRLPVALALWRAYRAAVAGRLRVRRPEAIAAGLELAAALVLCEQPAMAEVRRRYQVGAGSARYRAARIVETLRLVPGDARFRLPQG